VDASHLLTYISSYIFPHSERRIVENIVCGVSLGGHAAWHCLIHDPRITAAIIIIGCPDYIGLMTDRARLSRLATWTRTTPPGVSFLGSADFPESLIQAVRKYDPVGLLLGPAAVPNEDIFDHEPTEEEKQRVLPLMIQCLGEKRILNMSGGSDKLVPYHCSEPFLRWLKNATGPNGWFSDGHVTIEDIVFDGVGHTLSPGMAQEIDRFVLDILSNGGGQATGSTPKI